MELSAQIKNYGSHRAQAEKEISKYNELKSQLNEQRVRAFNQIHNMEHAVILMETIEWDEMTPEERKETKGTNSDTYLHLWTEMDKMESGLHINN